MGGAFIGLALVVSLFAAVPAKAEMVRTEDAPWLTASAILKVWEYNPTTGSVEGNPGKSGGSNNPNKPRPTIYANVRQESFTLSGDQTTWMALTGANGSNGGDGYAIAFQSDTGFFYGTGMEVTATFGTGQGARSSVFTLNDKGSFFSGFAEVEDGLGSLATGEAWTLDFSFTNDKNTAYSVFLLKKWEEGDGEQFAGGDRAPIPEPATLAILGLGLAGLAVARRRSKR